MAARRFVPSMSSLCALEAVDRLGSASAAAQELALTHSAISRQIKNLEGKFNMRLVIREGTGLKLTPAAREYCEAVRASLQDLSHASIRLKTNPLGGRLNLAILPAFGMHWLAPKLRNFAATCPEVTVNFSSRLAQFDFSKEEFDAAIHYGVRDWPKVNYVHLAQEFVLPVCAPGVLNSPLHSAEQLLDLPLLHLETRLDAWEHWCAHYNLKINELPGMIFDQFSTMASAAAHGLGVAILPSYLAQSEIEAGRLVCAFGDPQRASGDYYLVWPDDPQPRPPLEKFIKWLGTVT